MKVSYNWLKQYINCELSAEEIAKKLTGTGLEVEDLTPYESIKGALKGVVVGKVIYLLTIQIQITSISLKSMLVQKNLSTLFAVHLTWLKVRRFWLQQ